MPFLTAIDRYLLRLIIVPLFGTLVIAAMLLLLDKMLDLFDFVVNEGGPVSVVWRMLGNLVPEYLSLGIPIGVTLGILLGFRQLALSSELDALKAIGVGYGRLLRVPYMLAVIFAAVNFSIVGFLEPYSHYAYEGLRFELRSGALGASIKVGEFAKIAKNTTLLVDRSFANGADLRGVFVQSDEAGGQSVSVAAARGQFLLTDDPDVIVLRLKDGTLVHEMPKSAVPRVLTFAQYDLPVTLPAMERFRLRGVDEVERTIPELWRIMRSPDSSASETRSAAATFHRRMVQWVVMFVLPLLAVALGVPPKRSTSATGVFLSVVILVTYHKISEYGERMSSIGLIDPMLVQWGAFALFVALCGWFYHVLAHRPGGEPLAGLDRLIGLLTGAFARLWRRLLRRPVTEPQPAPGF